MDLVFEPRWVTKDEDGRVEFWSVKPHLHTDLPLWVAKKSSIEVYKGLKLAEFENKHWTECIYEVPQKTTGKIYKFDSSAIDALYDSNPENFKKFICGEIVCKLNEVIDAVNELKGVKNE